MQLDCLLRSLSKNAPKPDYLTVIYKATHEEFKKGYGKILDVVMIEETNFKQNVMDSMFGEYTLFLCDDDIVFKKIDFVPFEDLACFSYRLGQNIDFCYSQNKGNVLKNAIISSSDNNKIIWDWQREELDFGYPLSVTGHLFKTEMIKELTKDIEFDNPNSYEAALQSQLFKVNNFMSSYKDSRIVGVPANKVNTSFENRNGTQHPYTTWELNNRFLNGEVIDFERMNFDIRSAQQELEYKFINNEK